MLEKDQRLAVWRLDGNVRSIHKIRLTMYCNEEAAQEMPDVAIRPGFIEVLQELSQKHNFVHVAHTDHNPDILEETLRLTKLSPYFDRIITVHTHYNKYAWPHKYFAEEYGLSDEEAREKMIGLGVAHYDQPYDIPGVVFIEQSERVEDVFRVDTSLTKDLIYLLLEKGEGHFKKGFEALYKDAPEVGPKNHPFPIRHSRESRPTFFMQYLPVSRNDEKAIPETSTPKIFWVKGDPTDRKPTIITEPIRELFPQIPTHS